MRSAALATVLTGIALAPPVAGRAAAQSTVTVAVDGVPRPVPVLVRRGRSFVALARVAELLGGRVAESGPERAVLLVDDDELVVHRRMPFVRFEGRWYQMPEAAQKDETGFWLPASSLHHLLPVLWPGRFPTGPGRAPPQGPAPEEEVPFEEGRPGEVESGTIGRATPGGSDLEAIDVWSEPGRTRLGFRLVRPAGVTVDATLPGTVELHLVGVSLPAAIERGLRGVGLVDSVAVAGTRDGSAITLWLAGAASVYSVAPLRRPVGVEVVLLSAAADEAAPILAAGPDPRAEARAATVARAREPVSSTETADAAPGRPEIVREPPAGASAERRRSGPWRVVVDAGHGGRDPGARGPGGTDEKRVTLAIARALAATLEEAGDVEVVLTREDDAFVPLGERTRIANREGADLFVSIHANAARDPDAEGFETYFLSAAKTEDARRVARLENASIRYENPRIDPESLDDLNFILWDLAQNEYLRESSALAETVQEELDRRLPLKSRGVKQAPFYVLNGAFMPAVLFETAFITNPREEALLNDPAFRKRLVDGLAQSVLAYLERYRRKGIAPTVAR